MKLHALRQAGYKLMHDGLLELARVEETGIRIDLDRLQKNKQWLKDEIVKEREACQSSKVWGLWRKRFGGNASLTARMQLATIFYDDLRFPIKNSTGSGRASTSEQDLQNIDHPFIASYLRLARLEKALNTFLKGIETETVGDRLHPFQNLHTTQTYRSSSDQPNFQNFPVRNVEIAQLIRSLFIASKGCVLVENDFKGIEVSISACYHHDRNFIAYITTPGKDMHGDMAAQVYMLRRKEVSKEARYGAKNKFVFPQFYGDYYVACAKALWEWIDKGNLTTANGVSLKEHLHSKGIRRLGECDPEEKPKQGTFEHHLQQVEDDFWNNRFREYGRWRREWYRRYLDKGYFDLKTGFRIYGTFGRNEVTNYPIQGSAFHCLLWCLIQVARALRKYRMRSRIVGQIHDSMIGDVPQKELRDYLEIVEETTTVKLRKHWDWIIVPMTVEYEIAPPQASWFDKREVQFEKGRFYHPKCPKKFTTDPSIFLKTLKAI